MPFKDVPAKVDFVAQEHEVLKFWQEVKAFQVERELHKGQPHWSFIDGPITANNPMGVHHGWGRTYKDLYNRYWTMRGRELRYQNGFDCQGLHVEVEVEKELGFKSKKDIEAFGLERFVRKCKERVLRYAAIMTEQSIRLGYWMDWDAPDHLRWLAEKLGQDPQQVITVAGTNGPVTDTVEQIVGRLGMPELGYSYFTFSNENNYMIWTFLKKCWEKGWLYRGADVMPWCPRCATGLSQHEIATDGYAELTHQSVTVRFRLDSRAGADDETGAREKESLLVWTTTPWTLTSNVAAAVGPELTYVKVKQGSDVFYLSKGALHMLQGSFHVLAELKGAEMEGWTYSGPFDELPAEKEPGGHTELKALVHDIKQSATEAHRVILWKEVGEAEGTGIVHIAPGCGAEDFALGKEYHLPLVAPLNDEGYFVEGFEWLTGMQVSQVAMPIIENLKSKGLLYRVEPLTHRYPICWRCKTELVFRLVDEWFISLNELRGDIMEVTKKIHWIPSFGLERELDWLRNMHDWMISKKRYWGLALPFWECDNCHHYEVVGDEQELQARAVEGWDTFAGHTPHRPYVDAVKLKCPLCNGLMTRIREVGNPWLDAGIVPFSTLRYRTDREYWREWYPANWISESFPGQFRNWFYSLLTMATVIDNSPPFLENFGYGTLYAEDGRPMHKSSGNMIEFNEAANKMGVDVMRWLYCAHRPEANLLFGYTRADEVRRQFLIPLWNVYSFFVSYAKLDKWRPTDEEFKPGAPEGPTPTSDNLLDRWIVARLNQVVAEVREAIESSDPLNATVAVESFLDDLSNWYVRRSRRRFWKSELDADKNAAYATLYHVLVKLTKLLAPFTPFVTEVIYQNIVGAVRSESKAHVSVHHCDWPQVDENAVDQRLLSEMSLARQIASLGLSARGNANIKLRQPLAKAIAYVSDGKVELSKELISLIADELNVKNLEFAKEEGLLVTYRVLPDNKNLGPKFGAKFPQVRAALAGEDAAKIATRVRAGKPVTLQVNGETVELAPEDILVQVKPAEGLAVASDEGVTIAVDTVLTPELRAEGAAREIVRRVQTMRKEAGFNIDDHIDMYYVAEGELSDVMQAWANYIRNETLTRHLVAGEPPATGFTQSFKIDGASMTLGLERVR